MHNLSFQTTNDDAPTRNLMIIPMESMLWLCCEVYLFSALVVEDLFESRIKFSFET